MAITALTAQQWLARYGQAWERADPVAASQLFSEDCQYFETLFSDPALGRDGVSKYWSAVPEGQADITFGYRVLAVDGSTVIAHWTASFTRVTSQAKVSLDGVFVLEFDDAGACRSLREWWHRKEA